LARWCKHYGGWDVEIVSRDPESRGFAVQPRRWVVERSFAWLVRNRRLRIDYERRVQTSENLIEVAFIRLLVARLGQRT
jgi:putative transposase